jgi:hypothetical protein
MLLLGEATRFSGNVLIDFLQKLVEFSGGGVCFHLPVPIVVRPSMQRLRDFGPFRQAEFFNCRFDLVNCCHTRIIAISWRE